MRRQGTLKHIEFDMTMPKTDFAVNDLPLPHLVLDHRHQNLAVGALEAQSLKHNGLLSRRRRRILPKKFHCLSSCRSQHVAQKRSCHVMKPIECSVQRSVPLCISSCSNGYVPILRTMPLSPYLQAQTCMLGPSLHRSLSLCAQMCM